MVPSIFWTGGWQQHGRDPTGALRRAVDGGQEEEVGGGQGEQGAYGAN